MSIDERLTRLERGVRWWRRLAFLLFAAIGGMLLTGQAKWSEAQNLSVRSLRITDKSFEWPSHTRATASRACSSTTTRVGVECD